MIRWSGRTAAAAALAAGLLAPWARGATPASRDARLESARVEIERLRAELTAMERRERTLLGEIERLGAEQRLREAELEEIRLRLAATDEALAAREREIARLEARQRELQRYVAFRLRELYKKGAASPVGLLVREPGAAVTARALAFVAYLLERDIAAARSLRDGRAALEREREALGREREELTRLRADSRAARERVSRARAGRQALLARLRRDRAAGEEALRELERAADELARMAEGLGRSGRGVQLDVSRFRGLLDWPADGRVSRGFGRSVHPRFGTAVPHPGLDIEAPQGAPFRSVFDGRVVFASWLRGYGLTAIVDHGGGLLSVYAHASVLLAQAGEEVRARQVLGRVGDTGSLRGPHLYFELRKDGKPVDPLGWLRPR